MTKKRSTENARSGATEIPRIAEVPEPPVWAKPRTDVKRIVKVQIGHLEGMLCRSDDGQLFLELMLMVPSAYPLPLYLSVLQMLGMRELCDAALRTATTSFVLPEAAKTEEL